MAYIAKVPVGKYTYLYERENYRDKNDDGKVKSRINNCVGKLDPNGNAVYNADYVARMRLAGTPVDNDDGYPRFSVNDVRNAVVQGFGLTSLLRFMADKIGVTGALRAAMPKHADEVFALACHLVSDGEPFLHCQEWIESVEMTGNVGAMSSAQISRLLQEVTVGEREQFFRNWADMRLEQEYLALDITSVSSYSQLIDDVEYGYNRDGEDLAQINLCLLMGETSRLPIYQTTYSGSIKDVSTLTITMSKFDTVTADKSVLIVTDKGFYSKKNVTELLTKGFRFLVAVPFSGKFAKNHVDSVREHIDSYKNCVIIGNDTLRGVSKRVQWGRYDVWLHIIFNPTAAVSDREKLMRSVASIYADSLANPEKFINDKTVLKYISFEKTALGYKVAVKEDVVDDEKRYAGWLVLVSDKVCSAEDAIRIYRAKDVVEKGFLKLKNSLDLGRLRVHGDVAMQNKVFVGFVSLILLSHFHNTMLKHNLYSKYTLKQAMRVLGKRRVHKIGDTRIESPITKEQRTIWNAFDL